MSLIVETGAGLSNSESYVSVEEADAYHTARGVAEASWIDKDPEVKEAALRKATDYLLQAYRERWKGTRINQTQALDWPRWGVYVDGSYLIDNNVVPWEVRKASAELALRSLTADLSPDLSPPVKSESVGPITIVYADSSQQSTYYQAIDRMLSPLLQSSVGGLTMQAVRG